MVHLETAAVVRCPWLIAAGCPANEGPKEANAVKCMLPSNMAQVEAAIPSPSESPNISAGDCRAAHHKTGSVTR